MIVVEPKWMFSLRGGMVPLLVCTQESTTLGDLVSLWLIRGCALGPLEASALGGKTSSPDGKVR